MSSSTHQCCMTLVCIVYDVLLWQVRTGHVLLHIAIAVISLRSRLRITSLPCTAVLLQRQFVVAAWQHICSSSSTACMSTLQHAVNSNTLTTTLTSLL
eukprot:4971-Heterococcus_DN1.PRE.2